MSGVTWIWIVLLVGSVGLLVLAARHLFLRAKVVLDELERLAKLLAELENGDQQAANVVPAQSNLGDDPLIHVKRRLKLKKEKEARKTLPERRLVARLKDLRNKESR